MHLAQQLTTSLSSFLLTVLAGMQAQHSAISKLNDRIRQVLTYLQAVKNDSAPWDHEALRQIQTVVANLPQTVLPELKEELLRVSVKSASQHRGSHRPHRVHRKHLGPSSGSQSTDLSRPISAVRFRNTTTSS